MQNKGLIWTFIILLSVACLYQLSFTWVAQSVEDKAAEVSGGDVKAMDAYLDSMRSEEVYPLLGFTYADVKKYELNLGLDLKGGMNVTLEVSIEDVVRALAGNPEDPSFQNAINKAKADQKNSQEDFVTLFERAYLEVNPGGRLTTHFYNLDNKDKISRDATNEEVIEFIRKETDIAFDNSFEVIRTRVNLFGVAQPNIQKLEGSDRILVELPGVKNKERVRQLLQGTAKLEFWETYENQEIYPRLETMNEKLRLLLGYEEEVEESEETEETADAGEEVSGEGEETSDGEEVAQLDGEESVEEEEDLLSGEKSLFEEESTSPDDSLITAETADLSDEDQARQNPLFSILQPNFRQNEQGQYFPGEGPVVGYVAVKDTDKVNSYLAMPKIKAIFPAKARFLWDAKPYDPDGRFVRLIAVKVNDRDGRAPLEGDVIVDAYQSYGQFGGQPEITMKMDAIGAKTWKSLTKDNIGKSIAIVLDNYVYSFPTVQNEISGGISVITGQFEIDEAQLIANILKAGKLPAPARIVEEAVVGPSLGQEAINSGLRSFLIALMIVLLYMVFYYSKAGLASNVALLANLFFLIGVLASTNIALTLPGIAGIVLTIGMSVDANVLIYERIREEVRAGKGIRLAVSDGYSRAYSSIIDANVTTILTGIILWIFGSGPVEGFAKTLVIGIVTSLFSAIFITRLIFTSMLDRNKELKFSTKITENAFQNMNIGFVKSRKIYYIFSSVIIIAGLASLFTKNLNYGVDFQGGRSYVVRFETSVSESDVRNSLRNEFESEPEVKTFGEDNQLRITTDFMISSEDPKADEVVENALNSGLENMTGSPSYEIMSSQKVGPTIADDIKKDALFAIIFSMIVIFIYILIRFRKWQYGLGALAAIFHDVLVVLGLFSILDGLMPFSLEIDQAFIAAILTVVGYSINDTVVVFDRIREYLHLHKKQEFNDVVNRALNSTLSRTINTSLSTFFVLLMIFIFGGEVIRGFAFALLIGVSVGTYSSLFVATPVVVDLSNKSEGKRKK